MKKRFIAGIFCTTLFAAPLYVMAASCTDSNGNTVQGDVCGVIYGDCFCYDFPAK